MGSVQELKSYLADMSSGKVRGQMYVMNQKGRGLGVSAHKRKVIYMLPHADQKGNGGSRKRTVKLKNISPIEQGLLQAKSKVQLERKAIKPNAKGSGAHSKKKVSRKKTSSSGKLKKSSRKGPSSVSKSKLFRDIFS